MISNKTVISVSYSEKDLLYRWRNQSIGSDIHVYDREMAQFDIKTAKRYLKHKVYHSGTTTLTTICKNYVWLFIVCQ